ncbi:MAG: FecR domain-containing protein [Lachnospiraceae bacterium]|nr:FecR domain-containing protein [Lachnospiraceae bacterium]
MKKWIWIICGIVAAIGIAAALILIFVVGRNDYRSIKVFEIGGDVRIEREKDRLDAFENMSLKSGDILEVPDGGFVRLKLDDDKYVYLEAGTRIELYATGDEKNSKTRVFVERGSMLTEVRKKLTAKSSYDIVTPNTSMSIRGTKTLTEVTEDAATGDIKTNSAVYEGKVTLMAVKVAPDGKVVSVEKELTEGDSNSVSTVKEELVSEEDMKSIVDFGETLKGEKVESLSEEEAGIRFDEADFKAAFLENLKKYLSDNFMSLFDGSGLTSEKLESLSEGLNSLKGYLEKARDATEKAKEKIAEKYGIEDIDNINPETVDPEKFNSEEVDPDELRSELLEGLVQGFGDQEQDASDNDPSRSETDDLPEGFSRDIANDLVNIADGLKGLFSQGTD